MKFDPRKHHRMSTRLKSYDYAHAGVYFITAVTYRREMLFGEIADGEMKLNRRGQIVWEEWFASTGIRKEIRLYPEEFVVMPNHIHGIVWISDETVADGVRPELNKRAEGLPPLPAWHGSLPLRRTPRSLGSFVAGFKSSVTKRIRNELNETGIWQRNYHDRIIRSDRELDAIRKYIEANPHNWAKDEENPIR